MSARVFDLDTIRNGHRYGAHTFAARVALAELKATNDRQWAERERAIRAKRSAAGKLGAAAAKGKAKHCRFCREQGHYGNACPRREADHG